MQLFVGPFLTTLSITIPPLLLGRGFLLEFCYGCGLKKLLGSFSVHSRVSFMKNK